MAPLRLSPSSTTELHQTPSLQRAGAVALTGQHVEVRESADKGTPPMEGLCSVHLEVLDMNDNPPEIVLKSLPSPVREDAPVGTVVALISAKDLDTGQDLWENGKV
ncbi:hypothetical protein NFI96_009850 [Prochilodus magdalenae]|nr:hypothetical protein NFI96_009850 [Prochilodus magdalenae]